MHTGFSQPEVVRKFLAQDKLFVDARTLLIIMLRWSLPRSQISAVCELVYTPKLGSEKFGIKNVKPEAVPECKSFLREERGLTAQYYLVDNTLGSREKVRKHLPPRFSAQFYSASVFALARTVESDALLMQMCNVDNDGYSLAWFQFVLDSNVRAISWTCFPRKRVCIQYILKRRVLRRSYPPSYLSLPGWHLWSKCVIAEFP